jgi:DNA invertase Pin-like site-specific DNA recombinase
MLIGYARVSTADQNLDLQTDALTKAGCEKIFTDTACGATSERPGLAEALNFMRENDVLVVWKLDRLGRSLKHLIETVVALQMVQKGFRSLQENIDTSTSGGSCFFISLEHSQSLSATLFEIERRPDWHPREVGAVSAVVPA